MSSDSGRPRLQIPIQHPWFAIISRVQRALVGFAVGAFIFLSGGVLDWFVTRHYLPRISLMLAGAAVALAVGVLAFQILTEIQERYQAMMDRLQRVVELKRFSKSTLRLFVLSQYCAKFLQPLATMRICRLQLCLASGARGSAVFAAERNLANRHNRRS